MKSLAIILLIFSCAITGYTQSAFPSDGHWNKSTHYFLYGGHGQPYQEEITNYSYGINGSLISGNKEFLKLYNGNTLTGYVLITGDVVWFGTDTSNMAKMYDYSLQSGQVFNFPYSTATGGYSSLAVTTVDSVLIQNTYRKRISFQDFYGSSIGPVWIQGIGDINFGGIELDYAYTVWYMNYSELVCFYDLGEPVYGDCVVGIPESHRLIFPEIITNPADDELRLLIPEQFKGYLQLYTASGQLISELPVGSSFVSININSLKSGLYMIRFLSNGNCSTQKFIKR